MPELLVELVCEPLPFWAQNGEAPKELARRLCAGLREKGLLGEGEAEPSIFATPLRLAFRIPGVAEHAPERIEEKRGPREGAPVTAVMGFMRSVGLTSIEELKPRESKDRKGKFWFADIKVASQPAEALIPNIVVEAMRQLPWRKTMSWEANGFRWPRTLHRYLVLLGNKPLSLASVAASLPQKIEGGKAETLDTHGNLVPVASPEDWQAQLEARGITLRFEKRCEYIATNYAKGTGTTFGVLGKMDYSPLKIIMPVLASMTEAPRTVRVPLEGILSDEDDTSLFISMALEAELKSVFCPTMGDEEACLLFIAEAPPSGDGGVAQNSLPAAWVANLQDSVKRIVYARLADAQFYRRRDEAAGLDKLHESLKDIRYHLRLGSLYERSERLAQLSRFVAQQARLGTIKYNADSGSHVEDWAEEAGRYAQTGLASETVREFPQLAGIFSAVLYRDSQKNNSSSFSTQDVVEAITIHRGRPNWNTKLSPVVYFLCVAEHTDALVGLWAAGERASGSGDPFAMRRHARYLLTVLVQNWFKDFSLHTVIEESARLYRLNQYKEVDFSPENLEKLKHFIFKRLKYAMLEGSGIPHDIMQAAIYSTVRQKEGILSRMRESAVALHKLLGEEDGKNLQAAWVRASGLAKGFDSDKRFDAILGYKEEETALFNALERVERLIQDELSVERQILILAALRKPIDYYLDNVRVLEGTQAEQENRLALLRQFMDAVRLVADLDYLEGGERAAPSLPVFEAPADTADSSPSAPGV